MVELLITYGKEFKGLAAFVTGQSAEEFTRSIPWRVSMFLARASLTYVTTDALLFDEDLSYKQCLDVVESLRQGESFGVDVVLDSSFKSFIGATQTFIEERSRVGLAIKSQDPAVEDAYWAFSSVVDAYMVRPLRERQMRDAFFMASVRWSANFSVPGAGKTASLLGSYCFLRERGHVRRIVVVCPKSAFETWKSEWPACFGDNIPMRCFCLGDSAVMRLTREQRRRAVQLDSGRYNLMLFNYESLGTYVDELAQLVSEDTLLVFDEVHRVKAIGGQRAQWALDVSRDASYVVVLTGTPIPNTYRDVYNFLHILYPRDYDTFFGYEPGFLTSPSDEEIREINRAVRPFFCRTNKDELGVPAPDPDDVHALFATGAESRLMQILAAAYRRNYLLLMIRALQLASDASMLAEAIDPDDFEFVLDQVGDQIDDIDFVNYSNEVPRLIRECGTSTKMAACAELIRGLVERGRPVIVWCIFVRSITRMERELRAMGVRARAIWGSTPLEERERLLEEYRMGLYDVLVTNPHTLAESVSLHQVCHDGVYLEYSYNLVHLLQSKDRIHRLGLEPYQHTRYHFMQTWFEVHEQSWSLEEKIYRRLKEKEQTMMEAIDSGYLEQGYVDEQDIEIVLGDLFGDL